MKITIDDLQAYLAGHYKGWATEQGMFMKLVEEIGEVAEVLNTSQTMYARYERGANEMPVRHLITLCRFYNVSADDLLGTHPDPRRKYKKGAHLK